MICSPAAERPPIVLIEQEADALAELAVGIRHRNPNVSRLLMQEIDRAELVDAYDLPGDVVKMGCMVQFTDQKNGERYEVQLVYPGSADLAEGRLSILTRIGAGLIGLRTGQAISWPDRNGEERLLMIEKVSRPE